MNPLRPAVRQFAPPEVACIGSPRWACNWIRPGATVCMLLLATVPALAQQDPAPGQQPPSTQQQPAKGEADKNDKNKSQTEQSGTSKDRLFFALPNFLTVENAGQIPPLSSGEKFKVVARSSFDYVEFPWYG